MQLNNLSGGQYSVRKNIRFKTLVLRLGLCDYSSAYIVVKGIITVEGTNENNQIKNCPLTIMLHLGHAHIKN